MAYLTADVPGTGGVLKMRPEDFLVEEQPLYSPCGQGEHLYLYLEKRQRTTTDVIRRLAKLFNVRRSDIGYAGLKDKQAITRQHFSVRLPDKSQVDKAIERIEFTGLKLLWFDWHTNKLRRGHLAGNRFVIYIRQVEPTVVLRGKKVLDRLTQSGIPNFIGEQRFGYRQTNHLLGKHLLQENWEAMLAMMLGSADVYDPPAMQEARAAYEQGDLSKALELWPRTLHQERIVLELLRQHKTPRQAILGLDPMQREFYLNALQSALFNAVLDERLRAGRLDRLEAGDLAWKHDNGAVFAVDAATAEKENATEGRMLKLEVSPSGPMWGRGMTRTDGQVLERELAVLATMGLHITDFEKEGVTIQGGRRPLRVMMKDTDICAGVDEHGGYIRLAFELPKGSFATTALREIIKPEQMGTHVSDEVCE